MRITKITFGVGRAMPLMPITKRKDDEYANVKPYAECTVEFDADEPTHVTKANLDTLRSIVGEAMDEAQKAAFGSIANFSEEFRKLYKKPKRTATTEPDTDEDE